MRAGVSWARRRDTMRNQSSRHARRPGGPRAPDWARRPRPPASPGSFSPGPLRIGALISHRDRQGQDGADSALRPADAARPGAGDRGAQHGGRDSRATGRSARRRRRGQPRAGRRGGDRHDSERGRRGARERLRHGHAAVHGPHSRSRGPGRAGGACHADAGHVLRARGARRVDHAPGDHDTAGAPRPGGPAAHVPDLRLGALATDRLEPVLPPRAGRLDRRGRW